MGLLRRRPDIAITALDDGTFLIDPRTQAIFHLDTLGGGVWSALSEPMARDDLAALLVEAFPETSVDTINRDLDALLDALRARDLLIEV